MKSRSTAEDLPLRGRTIVVISSIDWGFLWQGHQEIASRFAAAGNRVIYVENTGVRSVRIADAGRVARAVLRLLRPKAAAASRQPGVRVVTPMLLPFPLSRVARAINSRVLIPRLARAIASSGADDPILFTFLPTPNALDLIEALRGPGSRLVYYCIADFRELSDMGRELIESEAALVRSADLVFVQSRTFRDRFASLNPHIHEFQFGVDATAFDPAAAPANELAGLRRPLIGYSGGLHYQVDLGLLVTVAEAFPAATVVIVGPLQRDPGALRTLPNVRLLGQRPFRELPRLVGAFDVALIPYTRTAYTDTVFPTKLFEYLAAGRPVVSTDLPEVRKLRLPTTAVRIAADVDAYVAAVAEVLEEPASVHARERAELARARDWSTVFAQMAKLIADIS